MKILFFSSWKVALSFTLIGILASCLMVALILVGILFNKTVHVAHENEHFKEICLTKSCISTASQIIRNMDETVDPCEDFYQFACGNYIKSTRIPEDRNIVSTLSNLDNILWQNMADLLENPNSAPDIPATTNAKSLYKSCMNEGMTELKGEEWFKTLLADEFNGWPILQSGFGDTKDPIDKLVSLRLRGVQPLVALSVASDPKLPNRYSLSVEQPRWLFSQSYYNDSHFMDAYKTYLTRVVELIGAPVSNPDYKTEIELMISLEKSLAQILLSEVEKRAMVYKEMTITELEATLPEFGWRRMVNGIFDQIPSISIPDSEKVIVYDWDYLTRAAILLTQAANDQRKILYNLMIWPFVMEKTVDLPRKYSDARQDFIKVYTGQQTQTPRARICTDSVIETMAFAAGRIYVEKYFDSSSKAQVNSMIEMLRAEFKESLKLVDWMDEASKVKAAEKADYIYSKVGYPDSTYNNTYLNTLYKKYVFDEENYVKNLMVIAKAETLDELVLLRKTRDLKDWYKYLSPAIVNAFYDPQSNDISFPAGILQAPLFDRNLPNYLNYGGIGYVIGHEITHGFDDQGRQYDKNGVHFSDEEAGLWSNETKEQYKKKAKCFVDQYNGYVVSELNQPVNGELTLGENIADNGGLKQSFKAYKRWEAKHGKERLLPGLTFSQEQLFFINSGQVWCGRIREASKLNRLRTDPHSPMEFRVIGPTSNFDAFAKAFKCPQNPAKLNKTCTIW